MFTRLRAWHASLTIVRRLVLSVSVTIAIVLAFSSAFVFWRVEHALDRQLSRDLRGYYDVVEEAVDTGGDLPDHTAGQWYQVYDDSGRIVRGTSATPVPRLASNTMLAAARAGGTVYANRGAFLPADPYALRILAAPSEFEGRNVVVAAAISRRPRNEALRELLLQLVLADALMLGVSAYVGYRTARAALDPVERYRAAAASAGAGSGTRLPVDEGRDDELARLGHTLNDLLVRLDDSLEREHLFITDASHELRTPLALLKAEVELALHKPRSADYVTGVLRSVGGQVDRLIGLANALLDLEELGANAGADRQPVDLHALLFSVAEQYEGALTNAGRTIAVDAPGSTVWVSERWLAAAVGNLVANSLRHGAGPVEVTATVGANLVEISVTDSGTGFSPDFADIAFDRFTRADASRTTPGSGLGLALVRAVAEAHGGTVAIEDGGHGARVVLRLPLDGTGPVPA